MMMLFSTSTIVNGPHTGTGLITGRVFRPGADPDELDPYSTWPQPGEQEHVHPWHDARCNAERFESNQDKLIAELLPRSIGFGDDVDDPGKLSKFHNHRIAESAVATQILLQAVPRARELGRYDDADRLHQRATAMLCCRRHGPVGYNSDGKIIVAWEAKCGLAKYCPDEAIKESKRLGEIYLEPILEHRHQGGRVYKGVLTLPNYPGGRLEEGVRGIFKRWMSKLWRAEKGGDNKFGIEGALLILEAPLGVNDDWNVHLNFILLTHGWLDYAALREAWGCNLHITEHQDFTDRGMAGLFNEMIKYGTRALPEKSSDGKHQAPAMCLWTGDELLEWDCAMYGLRRTRGYGALFGLGKPDKPRARVLEWLGYLHYKKSGYEFVRRAHDLSLHTDMLLKYQHFDLNLIRGDKSTTKPPATGPP